MLPIANCGHGNPKEIRYFGVCCTKLAKFFDLLATCRVKFARPPTLAFLRFLGICRHILYLSLNRPHKPAGRVSL